MSKRTTYTIVTPLPSTITRATAMSVLRSHTEMIQLNPLVIHHEECKPHANAPADEYHCQWYELTDRISYLPGVKGSVSYKACFHDLPKGLQTHVYAPAGLEIKEKWTIGGNEPGEDREVLELGLVGVPREGLYLREDVDMKANILLTSFVKKNLKSAHSVLVDRLVVKADLAEDKKYRQMLRERSLKSANSSMHTASPSATPEMRGSARMPMFHSNSSSTLTAGASPTYTDEKPSSDNYQSPDMSNVHAHGWPLKTYYAELPADKAAADAAGYRAYNPKEGLRRDSSQPQLGLNGVPGAVELE